MLEARYPRRRLRPPSPGWRSEPGKLPHDLLAHFFCLEEAAVAADLVYLNGFFIEEDIDTGPEGAQGCEQVSPHEVGQGEIAAQRAVEHRTAFAISTNCF